MAGGRDVSDDELVFCVASRWAWGVSRVLVVPPGRDVEESCCGFLILLPIFNIALMNMWELLPQRQLCSYNQ